MLAYVDAHNDTLVVSVSPPSARVTAMLVPLHTTLSTRPMDQCPCARVNRSADVVAAGGKLVYHRNAQPWADTYMVQS